MTEAGWTSKAPTKEGWYWMRAPKCGWRDCVVWVDKDENGFYIDVGDCDSEYVMDIEAEWLGPITPDSYQHGRVAGLQEAGDLHEQVNTYCDHEPKAGAGGMGVAIRYRDLIRQQATKLAQQAQDEKGGGDGKDCL